MTKAYFSLVKHLLTKLHNKFHIFITFLELLMNFTRISTEKHFLKKIKLDPTFLT